jgi:Tol biopolymer transport system component
VAKLQIRLMALTFAVVVLLVAAPVIATVSGEDGRIAFVADVDGVSTIHTMEADGSDVQKLTEGESPQWSPDGQRIVFERIAGEVWTMDADGSSEVFVTNGSSPSWSPDGKSLAMSIRSIGVLNGLPTSVIAVFDLDDGTTTIITDPGDWIRWTGTSTSGDWHPRWLPRGDEILFARYFPGSASFSSSVLLAVDVTTGMVRSVTGSLGNSIVGFDVSPTGSDAVATVAPQSALPANLQIVALDDTPPATLTQPDSHLPTGSASFSPTGTRIASGMWNWETGGPGSETFLWLMGLDGSDAMKLGHGWDPVWQPLNPYPFGLVDPVSGEWHLRQVDGHVDSFYFGNPSDLPFMGDWDCDGIDTPGLYRQSDGYVYLRNSNSQGVADVRFFFGNPGDVALAGDFNGDGCDTVSVYRPSNATFYIINELGTDEGGLGAADVAFIFGNPGDKPYVGDFDGDGVDTPGLHRESTGLVYYRNWNSEGVADAIFLFGDPGDRLVANDWNGDGLDSPGVFRPSQSTVFLRFTNTQGPADAQFMFGDPGWLPVTGTFE